jgi:hypothetical protein
VQRLLPFLCAGLEAPASMQAPVVALAAAS